MPDPDLVLRLRLAIVVDRAAAPSLLRDALRTGTVGPEELGVLIPEVWTGTDHPVGDVGQDEWVAMFREAGFLSVAYHSGGAASQPTGPTTIYRGATIRSGGLGMSWTRNRGSAGEFARRWGQFHGPSVVYQATVPPDAILALFEMRAFESEVVVDPAILRGRVSVAVPAGSWKSE
jgi:hypothetical protein